MELPERVAAALADGAAASTPDLAALLLETGGERCHRRERITYLLQRYLTFQADPMSAPSTTHRFKQAFADHAFNYEDKGVTRSITAKTLTNEDVPVLQQYAPHLIEALPAPQKQESATDLSKHTKADLQALHLEKVGTAAAADLTKDDLIKAITEATKA